MTIAAVGTGKFADTNGFTLTPGGTGHFILLSVITTSTTSWATGISNSGNVTWTVLVSHQVLGSNAVTETVFLGQVNSTSAQAQTISFNTGSPGIRAGWQEFSTTAGFSSVILDASGTVDLTSGGHFPAVTPTRSGDTYWSFIWDTVTGAAGSTSGYTYAVDGVHGNLQCYSTSCANATQTPNIGNSDGTSGIAVMVYESSGAVSGGASLSAASTLGASGAVALPGGASLSAASTLGASGTVSVPFSGGFPHHQLRAKVELLLNGTWTDITAFTYLRSPISISPFARTNEASTMNAAQVTLTLNNRSGRFTPGNSLGAYYPYVQLNTQIRISVADTSQNGTAYVGYRFWGELSSLPSAWDEGGRDVYVSVTASGIWQRLSKSTKRIGSPYTRYNNITVRNAWTLASYHPMEDGQGSATFANLVAGQAAMTVSSGTPTLASSSAFNGSDALPVLNGAVLNGLISTSVNPSNELWRFGMFLPSGGDRSVPAGAVLARMTTSGTVARVEVSLGSPAGGGPLVITGYNSGGTQLFTGSSTLSTWGIPMLVQVGLAQSGGNVTWSLRTMLPGATTANTTVTGSVTGTVDDVTGTVFNLAGKYQGTAVGQSVVIYGNPVITDASAALAGWPGEFAGSRFLRVCAEQGIPAMLTGSATSGTVMGPQVDDTLANVLQQIETTDGGQLFETRIQFGLGYRTRATLANQASAFTLDYAAKQLSAPLSPVTDDALTRNDVTLTNYDGYSVRAYLAAGARSIQNPPNGIGAGYEYTAAVSCTDHSQVNALAQQLLNSGTVSDPRYPSVTVKLARASTGSLFNAVPSAGVGDCLTLANLPAYGGAAAQKQLIWGWTETIGESDWTITFNTIPEAPWETGYSPGTAVSGQVPGAPTTFSQSGSVSGAQIAESAISLASLAQQVLTYQFGGITSNITGAAPSNPSDGDLWFDSGNGFQIKRWDAGGGSWVPVTFDGDNILGAGTITAGLLAADAVVAGNIAAGAVTANELAAGIVKAGIVNGTLISGAQFVAYGTTGEILVYSSNPPAAGNLVMSVSAMAGTDGQGNAYKAGVWIYDSGGNSMGLMPGGGSAASQLALSTGSATPTPPAGTAAIYAGASGQVQAVDGTDSQTYSVSGRRSLVLGSNATVSSSTYANLFTSLVAAPGGTARTYRVHAVLFITNGTSGVCGIQMTGPAGATGQFSVLYTAVANSFEFGLAGFGASMANGFATSSGLAITARLEGTFTVPAGVSGTLALQVATTGSAYFARQGSFIDIMPV